jgi:hypothetical protein
LAPGHWLLVLVGGRLWLVIDKSLQTSRINFFDFLPETSSQ